MVSTGESKTDDAGDTENDLGDKPLNVDGSANDFSVGTARQLTHAILRINSLTSWLILIKVRKS